jgi:N utilization substance protein A
MVMTARVMLGWVDPTELEDDAEEADFDGDDDEEAEA